MRTANLREAVVVLGTVSVARLGLGTNATGEAAAQEKVKKLIEEANGRTFRLVGAGAGAVYLGSQSRQKERGSRPSCAGLKRKFISPIVWLTASASVPYYQCRCNSTRTTSTSTSTASAIFAPIRVQSIVLDHAHVFFLPESNCVTIPIVWLRRALH